MSLSVATFADAFQARQPIRAALLEDPPPPAVPEPAETKARHCPIPEPRTLVRGLRLGKYRKTELGLEMRCSQCREYWPADTEFFFSKGDNGSGLLAYCKACYTDRYYTRCT